MSYYKEVLKNIDNKEIKEHFINRFLFEQDEIGYTMANGNEDEVNDLVNLLLTIDINEFIENINKPTKFEVIDIPQFSNLDDALSRVNQLIDIYGPLTFDDLGKYIEGSLSDVARKKYGENHAKTANIFCLVKFEKFKKYYVHNSSLGSLLLTFNDIKRKDILRKTILSNNFFKTLIYNAKQGKFTYEYVVMDYLKPSTATRRKSNCKSIVNFILDDTNYKKLKENIFW